MGADLSKARCHLVGVHIDNRLEAQSQTSRVGDRSRWLNWRIEIDEASLHS